MNLKKELLTLTRIKKPEWLRIERGEREEIKSIQHMLRELKLHTVCEESMCPNIGKCFTKKTATFLVMGDICTRSCKFCDIKTGKPNELDPLEPNHIVDAVDKLKLKHVVITSVTRDDLLDGGASHFATITRKLKEYDSNLFIELLIPDFRGNEDALKIVLKEKPTIINHNIEVVPRLFPKVTPQADYTLSLNLLRNVKKFDSTIFTKSGIMLGLGETKDEILGVLHDLRDVDCDMITIGQYLKPPTSKLEIEEYIEPKFFEELEQLCYTLGFKYVNSAPFVRSSYNADAFFKSHSN